MTVNGIALHYLDFALVMLFSAALALAQTVYRRDKESVYHLISVYFAMLLIVDLCASDMEMHGAVFSFLERNFSVPVLPTAICYCITAVILTELTLRYCQRPRRIPVIACLVFFPLWFINILLIKSAPPFIKWLYILPYQLLTLTLSVYALVKTRGRTEHGRNTVLFLLRATAVFSVLIVVEDTLTMWSSGAGFHLWGVETTRNLSENILQVIYALTAIRTFSSHLSRREGDGGEETGNVKLTACTVDGYARHIGLSARERDVLEPLLLGRSNQEICQALGISLGTAKAHTHNIYQKSSVDSRGELTESFRRFTADVGAQER